MLLAIVISLAIGYLVGFWMGHFVKFENFPEWAQRDLTESGWYNRMNKFVQAWIK